MSSSGDQVRSSRRRTTRWRVRVEDLAARAMISFGGIGTIVAVIGVFVFLAAQVIPLFQSARFHEPRSLQAGDLPRILHVAVDEYALMGWRLTEDGELTIFRLDDGGALESRKLFQDRHIEAMDYDEGLGAAAVALDDGSVHLVEIAFKTDFPAEAQVPEEVRHSLRQGHEQTVAVLGDGLVQLTRQGQFRRQRLAVTPGPNLNLPVQPVREIGIGSRSDGLGVIALAGKGEQLSLYSARLTQEEDFLTGESSTSLSAPVKLPIENLSDAQPIFVGLSALGSDVYVVWEDGHLARIRTLGASPFVAETGRLCAPGGTITAVSFVQGRNTLVWGDTTGRLRGGFLVPESEAGQAGLLDARVSPQDRLQFVIAKDMDTQGSTARTLAPSTRSRLLLAGFEDGVVRLYNVTNEGLLGLTPGPDGQPIREIAWAPKEDGALIASNAAMTFAALDPKHPEVTFRSLFTRVWYEGYSAPMHTWQSSGLGGFEPKLGMVPLIFGTLKATFYAMLFGAPLALLAAVFSSEFLDRRARTVIKPCIELMASLPSVVLGFLAALVLAPFVERVIAAVLMSLITLPAAFLLAAYLWQLLPTPWASRLAGKRLLAMIVPLALGMAGAAWLGPVAERWLFGGDLKAWTAWGPQINDPAQERFASAAGGWMFLLLPVVAIGVAVLVNRTVTARWRRGALPLTRARLAVLDLAKFLAAAAAALALAWVIGWMLSTAGLDPRADILIRGIDLSPVDTYVQRNSLVVGFIMGFAIIPLIYTISDDALAAVPDHLRSASLGAGATPWQTAVRIVIPTAMSGLFSALMIGLGRAVGETMIVLMASGGTPVLDMNIFEGFRTLSANIAVELPEAPRGSTHYRTLFLAALVLFLMTFAANTVAEIVRQRYRKRAVQL